MENAAHNEERAQQSTTSPVFLYYYDEALKGIDKVIKTNWRLPPKYSQFIEDAKITINSMYRNYQWYLRDAIDRDKSAAVKNIKTTYRNSGEHKQQIYYTFCSNTDYVSKVFDTESKEFAEKAKLEVAKAAGISVFPVAQSRTTLQDTRLTSSQIGVDSVLKKIDAMSGLDFEYFCADLLRANGFSDVTVTQSSGDQGVDVLAKKDGIKYAIQCKCYSGDLGNTPVQVVSK